MIADVPDSPALLWISYLQSSAELSWQASPGTVAGYHIYRNQSTYFTLSAQGTLIGTVDGITTTYTDTNVIDKYYYRVTSFTNLK